MVQLTTEQKTFVIKTFYETNDTMQDLGFITHGILVGPDKS